MRLTDKAKDFEGGGRVLVGKRKNYVVTIEFYKEPYETPEQYWCYSLEKGNYHYNSLWDNLKYNSSEECVIAATQKIEELKK